MSYDSNTLSFYNKKSNDNHDEHGRFSEGDTAAVDTAGNASSKANKLAERNTHGGIASENNTSRYSGDTRAAATLSTNASRASSAAKQDPSLHKNASEAHSKAADRHLFAAKFNSASSVAHTKIAKMHEKLSTYHAKRAVDQS